MRYVLKVLLIKQPGFYEFPGVGPVRIAEAGHYGLTQAELVGPFEDRQEALRITALVARRHLRPGFEKPPPYKRPYRIVDV